MTTTHKFLQDENCHSNLHFFSYNTLFFDLPSYDKFQLEALVRLHTSFSKSNFPTSLVENMNLNKSTLELQMPMTN
jgi:hypothetical protein